MRQNAPAFLHTLTVSAYVNPSASWYSSNSSLTVFYNDRCNNRVSLEGILMSLYACNSAPVVCTDIYHSLLVTGQKFNFTIDFSIEQHQVLTSNPLEVSTFEVEQARLLECGRAIARELIHHHRAYYHEYIN